MSGHILACGAGRTLMDKRDDPIHRFTLELAGKERPRVLFLGTAAADDPSYIVSFYETYCAHVAGLCWFQSGTTDSFGPDLRPLADGLGFLDGSFCPHYDAEDGRQPLYHQAILDGTLPDGYAVDNLVGLHFRGTELVGAVTSQAEGRALRVRRDGDRVVEEPLPTEVLC